MTEAKPFETARWLPYLVRFLVHFVVGFVVLGVGFSWYGAHHVGEPPKPSGTIDWNRVLVAGVCGLVAEIIVLPFLWLWRKRARR